MHPKPRYTTVSSVVTSIGVNCVSGRISGSQKLAEVSGCVLTGCYRICWWKLMAVGRRASGSVNIVTCKINELAIGGLENVKE